MLLEQVVDHFKSGYRLNEETGMSANNLSNWIRLGYVPILSQIRLERMTDRQLIADLNHVPEMER